jgi:hypothetical protein
MAGTKRASQSTRQGRLEAKAKTHSHGAIRGHMRSQQRQEGAGAEAGVEAVLEGPGRCWEESLVGLPPPQARGVSWTDW